MSVSLEQVQVKKKTLTHFLFDELSVFSSKYGNLKIVQYPEELYLF